MGNRSLPTRCTIRGDGEQERGLRISFSLGDPRSLSLTNSRILRTILDSGINAMKSEAKKSD